MFEKVYDLAPDGSEIRLLPRMSRGSLCHCTLPVSITSVAVCHRAIEEIWYVLSGDGQIWRKLGQQEEVVALHSGVSVTMCEGFNLKRSRH
jgi:mannose-6-phosphate isomerase-like protein (cupin superfamily)